MEKSDKKMVGKKIHRERVYVDQKFVDARQAYAGGGVTYGLYTANDLTPPDIPKLRKSGEGKLYDRAACFYSLMSDLNIKRKIPFNRIYYDISMRTNSTRNASPYGSHVAKYEYSPDITLEQAKRWLQLLKEHKIIPKYVDENVLHEPKDPAVQVAGTVVINLDGLSPAQLYMYLSSIRDLHEYSKVVKWVLYLVGECGVDFYAAYTFGCKICSAGGGHHFIALYGRYGDGTTTHQLMTIPISMAIGLHRFAKNPKRYDPRDLIAASGPSSSLYNRIQFNCSTIIQGISKATYECTLDDLADRSIVSAIRSLTDKTARKHIGVFKARKPRIVYNERKVTDVKKQDTNSG